MRSAVFVSFFKYSFFDRKLVEVYHHVLVAAVYRQGRALRAFVAFKLRTEYVALAETGVDVLSERQTRTKRKCIVIRVGHARARPLVKVIIIPYCFKRGITRYINT